MPLISPISRRHPRTRALREGIFVLLLLGALTMVYPFALLVGGSFRSAVDAREDGVVPRFLFDDGALYRKHIEALFNERLDALRCAYDMDLPSFDKLVPPDRINEAWVHEWLGFATNLEASTFALGHFYAPVSKTLPLNLRGLKSEMSRRFDGDLAALNRHYGMDFADWTGFFVNAEEFLPRRTRPTEAPFEKDVAAFRARQPALFRVFFSAEGYYKRVFLKARYTASIAAYNAAHGTTFASYDDIRMPASAPSAALREVRIDWEEFVRKQLNILWVRMDAEPCATAWRQFLAASYGSPERYGRQMGRPCASFDRLAPAAAAPLSSPRELVDWESFLSGWKDPGSGILLQPAPEALRIEDATTRFRDHLRARYGKVAALNAACCTTFASFDEITAPQRETHYALFMEHRGELRREFLKRNYAAVVDYLLTHGSGIRNTVVYCGFSVLCALIFNPLAAYALSRFRPPSTYKFLLLLLLTMAFPPMVTQIPAFLMLRDLGLLNSYWALILPGIANGYSIFLLKGFFDSLPRDLYESAQIDGASEWTMFWQISMSLSKPILAVTALHAFTAAYANFMFALLICQDRDMWTLMVWLYELQQRSGQGVVYASLVIAAVPTLLIFSFCQRIIMRGIVIPVEK